ncbi:MAG: hypothetical protein WBN96_10655 [Gammaproteobacteria bacterium]
MQALSVSMPPMYAGYLHLLVISGYGFLLMFPTLAVFSLAFLGFIIWQNSPLNWQMHDGLLAAALVLTCLLAALQSYYILKVKPELPPGRPLKRKDFPVLRARIDELCTTYNSPALHHVKLTTRFGIEIIRTPHTGFPSRFTNTLLIGLPVMSCMSPLHLKLLLAREIGHLALTRRNYQRRIPYLASVWRQYAALYSEYWNPKTILLRLFFTPFAVLFTNSAYPAIRTESFIKDACMLDITTTTNAAEVIATFAVKRRFLDEQFWPVLNRKAFLEPRPPYMPYSSMDKLLSAALNEATAQVYFEAEVSQPAQLDSELPNLRERLLETGYEEFVMPERKTENAANHFLGDAFRDIQKQLDNVWYLKNKTTWAMRYKRGVEEKSRLKILRDQAAQALLSNTEAREYLLLIEKYIAADKALPLYMEILKTNSLDAHVCYEVGRLLLAADDKKGVDALHMAMDMANELTADCCQHIVNYMAKTGDMKKAQDYRRKILAHQVEA